MLKSPILDDIEELMSGKVNEPAIMENVAGLINSLAFKNPEAKEKIGLTNIIPKLVE